MNSSDYGTQERKAIGTMPATRRFEVWERGALQDTHEGPGLVVEEAMRLELTGWPEGYEGGGLTFWEEGPSGLWSLVGCIVVADDGTTTATAIGSETHTVSR
jgi:hypothetical protein